MADPSTPAPVTDRRPRPRGVIPRNVQTWLMVGLAVLILAIIVFTGHPEPPRPPSAPRDGNGAVAPEPERLRDYQERLRALDARARQDALTLREPTSPVVEGEPKPTQVVSPPAVTYPSAPATPSPLDTERARREYDSLFASNVVVTRRTDGQMLATRDEPTRRALNDVDTATSSTPPSLDEVAAAVMRATSRYAQSGAAAPAVDAATRTAPSSNPQSTTASAPNPPTAVVSNATAPITAAGSLHRLLEGTVIDTVLTNRLDGSATSPVVCLVTNPVFSHGGDEIVIPAGARIVGATKPVQALGDTRLAVAFHRLEMPDGRTYTLDDFSGMNQLGDTGLRDQVNQHYWSTFGAAGAVGLISGLAQYVATGGIGRGDGTRTVVIAGGVGDAASQATMQAMNRFLNRLPQITIREGHRIKVYLTSDLELPAYDIDTRADAPVTTARR